MNELQLQLGLEKLRKEWEPKGFKCEIYKTNSVELWSNPGHKTDEFFILLEGEVEISFPDEICHLSIGEIFKLPAHKPHKSKYSESTCLYWIYAFDWQWQGDGSAIEEGQSRFRQTQSS